MPRRRSAAEESERDPTTDIGYDPKKHEQGKYGTGGRPETFPKGVDLRTLLDELEEKRREEGVKFQARSWRFWKVAAILNQGTTPQCVGYAWRQFLSSFPSAKTGGPTPTQIWQNAQKLDEYPGEDPNAGTSTPAGGRYLKQINQISHYVGSQSVADFKTFILYEGCIVMSSTFYNNMVKLDNGGYARPSGGEYGRHAYLVSGFSARRNAFRCVNSWGEGWGRRGRFWVKYADMGVLIANSGLGLTAIKR